MADETSGNVLDVTLRDFTSGQKVFNRYTLIKVLGRGGMGIVWLANDEVLERDVALKFVPEIVVLDPGVLSDLRRETKRSLELTHKNIVRIYDFVHDANSACISMEYIDGCTLSGLRVQKEKQVFETNEIADWISQACDALDYAHNHARIVHRDLKPSNLMINRRGDMKVADFGIARSLTESVSMLTHARATSGTLVYMSPQQLDGERGTHLDDIYSLGATIYQLLTSKPPFYSGDVNRQVHDKIPPTVMQRRKDFEIEGSPIPRNWEETIASCLAKNPAKRPQSVADVADRLELQLSQVRTAAEPQPKRSKRKQLLAVSILILCAGLVAGWYFRILPLEKFSTALRSPSVIERRTENLPTKQTVVAPAPLVSADRVATKATAGTKKQPFINSLGMKFVPVPGTEVLFSIWDTRVQDYEAFAKVTERQSEKPGFEQGPTHPAVIVSWDDAKAFCAWLTEKEQKAGMIGSAQEYRLPTDAEWSVAVGLPHESGRTPREKDDKITNVYPWGDQWPPPKGAGNYSTSLKVDSYEYTSPVGSFEPNKFGLYDMGGNVWQWCEDWYDDSKQWRVLRGASWGKYIPVDLLSSWRLGTTPTSRYGDYGFRCVLAGSSSAR